MKAESCKLYSRDFWIFLPNNIKVDHYNFELYHFISELGRFLRHSVVVPWVSTDQQARWVMTGRKVLFSPVLTNPLHSVLYNIWMFVYFLCFQTPPKRRVIRRRNLARSHVTTTSMTSVGFCVYRSRRYQIWHFKTKIPECKQTLCSTDGRSANLAAPRHGRPVLLIALLLTAQATYWANQAIAARCGNGLSIIFCVSNK